MLFRAVFMLTTGTANPAVASGSGTDVLSQMCWGYRASHPLNSPMTWGCQEMEQWWGTLPEAQPALSIQPGQDQNVPQHSCWHWCHPCPQRGQTAVPGVPSLLGTLWDVKPIPGDWSSGSRHRTGEHLHGQRWNLHWSPFWDQDLQLFVPSPHQREKLNSN